MTRILFFLIAILIPLGHLSAQLRNSKPNIIFILADDMSYYDLSCLGQKEFQTPNIDKLYSDGLFFSEALSGAPECAPSRSTLMEGKHLGHNRVRLNSSIRGQDHLVDEDITVAEMLKLAGYKTGFVGKWGIGLPGTEGTPDKQGFDYAFGYYDQGRAHTFFPHFLYENDQMVVYQENFGFDMTKAYQHTGRVEGTNVYDVSGRLIPNGVKDPEKAQYSQNLIHEKAMQFIRNSSNSQFFLYYATQLPHGPLITPELGDYKDKPWDIKHKEWAAMMGHLDRHVGELVNLTKELGVDKNTVFIFASDNGYAHYGYMNRGRWEDDPLFKNKGPWKGGKFGSFDGGVRVPMIAYCPGKIPQGTTDVPVVLYDFMATACDLAGIDPPDNDGISIVPLLEGCPDQQEKHAYFYWGGGAYMPQAQAVRLGRWFGVRTDDNMPVQLYDLQSDIGSIADVSGDHPDVVTQMIQIMIDEHINSEWYQNPGDTKETIDAKYQLAIEQGGIQNGIRGNTFYPDTVCSDGLKIPKAQWSISYVDSEETDYRNLSAERVFDDDNTTIWHSQWYNANPPHPHTIDIDLGAVYQCNLLTCLPRQDLINGRIKRYELYLSKISGQWGMPVETGVFENSTSNKHISFPMQDVRFVRLVALDAWDDSFNTTVAEITLYNCEDVAMALPSVLTEELEVYPVPTNGIVHLIVNSGKIDDEFSYRVYTMNGTCVKSGSESSLSGQLIIDLAGCLSGGYFIKLQDSRGRNYIVRVIKK